MPLGVFHPRHWSGETNTITEATSHLIGQLRQPTHDSGLAYPTAGDDVGLEIDASTHPLQGVLQGGDLGVDPQGLLDQPSKVLSATLGA